MMRRVLVRAEVSGIVEVSVPDDEPDAIDAGDVRAAAQSHSVTWDETHVLDWAPYDVIGDASA